jgi:hypothetical protein
MNRFSTELDLTPFLARRPNRITNLSSITEENPMRIGYFALGLFLAVSVQRGSANPREEVAGPDEQLLRDAGLSTIPFNEP